MIVASWLITLQEGGAGSGEGMGRGDGKQDSHPRGRQDRDDEVR